MDHPAVELWGISGNSTLSNKHDLLCMFKFSIFKRHYEPQAKALHCVLQINLSAGRQVATLLSKTGAIQSYNQHTLDCLVCGHCGLRSQ